MKKTEAMKLIFAVKAGYPVYYRNVTNTELEAMADLWTGVLEGYSFNECYTAVITYIRSGSKEILQSPGQVVDEVEKLREATRPEGTLTPVDAWERYVRPAIRDGLYHSQENFDKMPEIVQRAIKTPDYLKEMAMLSSETIDSVERSNFVNRVYPETVRRRAQEARIPASVRRLIKSKREENEAAYRLSIKRREAVSEQARNEAKEIDIEKLRKEHNPKKNPKERKCDICGKLTKVSELITVADDDFKSFKMVCKNCYNA